MHDSLRNIVSAYNGAELKILAESIDSTIYYKGTQFGGNQGSPQTKSKELADIVRKYYPNFTDDEVNDYLKKLNDEGCGYVAMVNTIFKQYVGREEEFEKTFGFPMYDKNGDLNYDTMITDFYSATDNHNQKQFLMFKWDAIDKNEDISSTDGASTYRESREYRWEKYLKDHNVDVDVKMVDVTIDNYNAVSEEGDLIVGVSPVILRDASGKVLKNMDGGHAMTVTGKTSNGLLQVSSWGEKYYIDPKDSAYNRVQFQQIIYKQKGN